MNHYGFGAFAKRRQAGFTLVELIVVIVVVSILSVTAVIAITSSIRAFRLNAASAKVISDIRYAQQQARARNGWYGVRFQANPINRYNVYFTNGTSDIDVLNPANPAEVLDVNVAAAFGGVAITGVVIAAGNKVEFNPIGFPYDDMAGSPLAADGTVTLSLGGSTRTIKILKGTGRAEIQ